MSWVRAFIDKLLFDQHNKPQAGQEVADPFNFLMSQYLRFYQGLDAPLIEKSTQQFPALSRAAAQQVLLAVAEAYKYAAARQYDVRDGLLTQVQAEQEVRQQFPQLDEVNVQTLMAQTLAGAYR